MRLLLFFGFTILVSGYGFAVEKVVLRPDDLPCAIIPCTNPEQGEQLLQAFEQHIGFLYTPNAMAPMSGSAVMVAFIESLERGRFATESVVDPILVGDDVLKANCDHEALEQFVQSGFVRPESYSDAAAKCLVFCYRFFKASSCGTSVDAFLNAEIARADFAEFFSWPHPAPARAVDKLQIVFWWFFCMHQELLHGLLKDSFHAMQFRMAVATEKGDPADLASMIAAYNASARYVVCRQLLLSLVGGVGHYCGLAITALLGATGDMFGRTLSKVTDVVKNRFCATVDEKDMQKEWAWRKWVACGGLWQSWTTLSGASPVVVDSVDYGRAMQRALHLVHRASSELSPFLSFFMADRSRGGDRK